MAFLSVLKKHQKNLNQPLPGHPLAKKTGQTATKANNMLVRKTNETASDQPTPVRSFRWLG